MAVSLANLHRDVAKTITPDADLFTRPTVGPPAAQRVQLCGLLRRDKAGYSSKASSLPGHTIQLTLTGEAMHDVGGRRYVIKPRRLIWYHEDEFVRIGIVSAPWTFLTLNFLAPALSPPPFEQRVRDVSRRVERLFLGLLRAWRDESPSPAVRELLVHARLSDLLAALAPAGGQGCTMDPAAELWWRLESQLRRDLSQPMSLGAMSRLVGRSHATIARSCLAAVGAPPARRMKQVRLSLARGLVQRSELLFKEVAARVGYGRVHEFSRDYRRHFGVTPTADRARSGP